ncbi:MAG: ribonuclease R [Gammaproteobacteria bacterium]|nr:ribonuclease R [Gammaproteobacteria bacterium]
MKKKTKPQKNRTQAGGPRDPFAEREAQKYPRPIASREAILAWLEKSGKPLHFERLAQDLHLHHSDEREALSRRLTAMLRDGQLVQNRRGEYVLLKRLPLVAGTVTGHRDGFGFLIPDEGGDDVFLPPRQMRELMHGDRAVVRVMGRDARGRPEGSLVDVLERNTKELAGRYVEEHGVSFLQPDNTRISHEILIPPAERGGARNGQMVVVEITQQPSKRSQPLGRVVRVLGERLAPGMEIEVAIYSHGLPHAWPAEVEREVATYSGEVPESAKAGRLDLRRTPLVTIDGEDARDFDDAVYCERVADGFRLLVAIADVAHYVRPDSALDTEARNRGNSVYFPDRVIPMLPEILSNGLCSLNPRVDRLCLVCEMRVNGQGEVTRSKFHAAVMRSAARLTYTQVAGVLVKKDPALWREHAALLPHLENLYAVYQAFAKARSRRGAIDFDTTETRIQFGDNHKVLAIKPLVRNDAHRLIEECMIAANVEAARFLARHKLPTLYRVHAGPEADGLKELHAFLGSLGLRIAGGNKPQPEHYAKLLERVQQRPDRDLIETVLLRSLSRAVYSPVNIGHFGLALKEYGHFTSPIRRYPDLLVHRGIYQLLGGGSSQNFAYSVMQMENLGSHCSMTERRADEATRDAVDWLKTEFMQDKLGEEFDGLITGVTPFGVFVQLKNLYVEGLVHVTSLPSDYYDHDAVGHRLVGERSGRVFRLTDAVRVRVVNVNLEERKIDFELAGMPPACSAHRGRKPARPARARARR